MRSGRNLKTTGKIKFKTKNRPIRSFYLNNQKKNNNKMNNKNNKKLKIINSMLGMTTNKSENRMMKEKKMNRANINKFQIFNTRKQNKKNLKNH